MWAPGLRSYIKAVQGCNSVNIGRKCNCVWIYYCVRMSQEIGESIDLTAAVTESHQRYVGYASPIDCALDVVKNWASAGDRVNVVLIVHVNVAATLAVLLNGEVVDSVGKSPDGRCRVTRHLIIAEQDENDAGEWLENN